MDCNDDDFKNFLQKVNKLENIIEKQLDYREFNSILRDKFNIDIKNVDIEYNKLLIKKVTENLIHEKIFNLIN